MQQSEKIAPRVSVIMAVYNGEKWLAEAIDSVLAQTYGDFEFLIHDDGSTDGSPAILSDYAARDPRIILSSAPNRGLPASLNLLIDEARGEFLARMDGDDICYPERFSRQVAYLDAHPDIAVLGSRVRVIDDAGRPVHFVKDPTDHAAIDARNIDGRTAISHPSVMMRRNALLAVGGYDTSFRSAQDLELWLRMGEKFRLANFPEVLFDYRFHSHSTSAEKDGSAANNTRARQLAANRRGMSEDSIVPLPAWSWRPAPGRKGKSDFAVYWAWKARAAGYKDTARYYFLQAIKLRPFSLHPWKNFVGASLRDMGILK